MNEPQPDAYETHYFTFGQNHMTNYPFPRPGRLADYIVKVTLPQNSPFDHRTIFIDKFMHYHCPSNSQFSMEYTAEGFRPEHFPAGILCELDEHGIINNRT